MKAFRNNIHRLVEAEADSLRQTGESPFCAAAMLSARRNQQDGERGRNAKQKRRGWDARFGAFHNLR
jgi:hypothetical protein